MGRQYNKVIKRKRRVNYLKRKGAKAKSQRPAPAAASKAA